nr:hypothetical protein [Gemmatimonadota bacterium]NIR78131.1 hypothetical protein [Gemmatimonadota bacterium]NIT86693.1 hypothetical protein [Gemmatimonadota bacterium]NIU30551.1 hypothetical protein [Gemmatimonadota bacterium]NIU35390.1 hypothetical protein [Gemmatimonadota bacterium]
MGGRLGGAVEARRQDSRSGTARARALAAAVVLLVASVSGTVVLGARSPQEEPFPHDEHAGLFPVCTGCHAGIPEGNRADAYPRSQDCVGCHDGVEQERVEWTRPEPRASNLRFTHPEHARELAEADEASLTCESCHSADPDRGRMAVRRARVDDSCLSCHAHEADVHYESTWADADCATCHAPLAESGYGLGRLETLPEPRGHDGDEFLGREHGEAAAADPARCATCHVQDRCVSCHVNAGRAEVAAVPPAPAGMALPEYEAAYNVPESHRDRSWLEDHGAEASVESCSTCHTRDDCAACHQPPLPAAATAFPSRAEVRAPGVALPRRPPESHLEPAFETGHGPLAEARSTSCAGCHTEVTCTSCHAGSAAVRDPVGPDPVPALALGPPSSYRHELQAPVAQGPVRVGDTLPPARAEADASGFHPPNYTIRHAADAWGRTLECANCHSTEVFCRSCHVESGIGSRGQAGPGYHDAIPLWLFRHGVAARQGLESCASCHREAQCLRCHSTVGSFRVSPHGPDFDPERAR